MKNDLLSVPVTPDAGALVRCIQRAGTPQRVHYIELFLDGEVQAEICKRYGLADDLDRADPFFSHRLQVRLQQFLGYDYVRCGLEEMDWPFHHVQTEDTATIRRAGGRAYMDEHTGPV